jgi:hypothetical protein
VSIIARWKRARANKINRALQNELLRIRRMYLEILNVPPDELARLEALGVIAPAHDKMTAAHIEVAK